MTNPAEAAIQPAEEVVNPTEIQPTAPEVVDELPKATLTGQAEQEPKNHLAIIAGIEQETGVKCELEQVRVVIKAITNLVENPDATSVMAVLCSIAKQGEFSMIGHHRNSLLTGLARSEWNKISGAQPAEKAEPNVTAQAEGKTVIQPSNTSGEIKPPPANEAVASWGPLGPIRTEDKIGGPTAAPGKRLD